MARKTPTVPQGDPDLLPKRRRSPVVVVGVAILGSALALSSFGPLMSLFEAPPASAPTQTTEAADRIKALELAAQVNPKDSAGLISLGNALYDAGDFPRAAETYAKALALAPKNPDVRVDMGTALFYQGKAEDAIKAFHQALKDDPRHLHAHVNLGIVYRASGNQAEAKAHWTQALGLTKDPDLQKRITVLLKSVGG